MDFECRGCYTMDGEEENDKMNSNNKRAARNNNQGLHVLYQVLHVLYSFSTTRKPTALDVMRCITINPYLCTLSTALNLLPTPL